MIQVHLTTSIGTCLAGSCNVGQLYGHAAGSLTTNCTVHLQSGLRYSYCIECLCQSAELLEGEISEHKDNPER